MKYNKKNQPFTILGRFRILEENGVVEYCRIQFHNTGHVTNIPAGRVSDNDFEDESIKSKTLEERVNEAESKITVTPDIIETVVSNHESDSTVTQTATEITLNAGSIDIKGGGDDYSEVVSEPVEEEAVIVTDDFNPEPLFIATDPDGKELSVVISMEEFCKLHDLDPEAVQACLDGKQKTHRKWRFANV